MRGVCVGGGGGRKEETQSRMDKLQEMVGLGRRERAERWEGGWRAGGSHRESGGRDGIMFTT